MTLQQLQSQSWLKSDKIAEDTVKPVLVIKTWYKE